MKDSPAVAGPDRAWYEIQVQGRLSSLWATRFEGMTLTSRGDGTTLLQGPVADQAALHGLLRTLGDLGIPLLSVRHYPGDGPTDPTHTVQGD
jgi:hypothetical protein